jgi:hypothetical protein
MIAKLPLLILAIKERQIIIAYLAIILTILPAII